MSLSKTDLCMYGAQIFLNWEPYCGVWYTPEQTSTGYKVAYKDSDEGPEYFRPDQRYSCLAFILRKVRKMDWEVNFQIKNMVYTGTVTVKDKSYSDSVSQVEDPAKSNECSLRLLLKVWESSQRKKKKKKKAEKAENE